MANGADDVGASKGKRTKLIIIVAACLVLLSGIGAGAFFMFGSSTSANSGEQQGRTNPAREAAEKGAAGDGKGSASGDADAGYAKRGAVSSPAAFIELPELLVNLRTEGRRMRYLKLRVALEIEDPTNADAVRNMTPRIIDSFQLYLRALDAEEVEGSAGMQRLKEELLARVNYSIEPARIDDVLVKEMLVQ